MHHEKQAGSIAGVIEIVKYTFEISETRGGGGGAEQEKLLLKEDWSHWMHCFGKNFNDLVITLRSLFCLC